MPVTFLTVLPLTQLIVLFDLLAPEPGFAGVVAVVDEPEEDAMALLMGVEADKPAEDDMSEEKLLRALMEAQGQG